MKDTQEMKKSNLWRFVHNNVTSTNPQTDIKGINLQQSATLKHNSKGLGIGKKYVQQCIFRRQPEKQKKHKQITQQFIKSSRVYRSLYQQLKLQNQFHRQQMSKLTKIYQSQHLQKVKASKDMDVLNKQIRSLQNQILQISIAIQQEQQLKTRLIEQYQGNQNDKNFQNYQNDQQIEQQNQMEEDIRDQQLRSLHSGFLNLNQNQQLNHQQSYNHDQLQINSNISQKYIHKQINLQQYDQSDQYQKISNKK